MTLVFSDYSESNPENNTHGNSDNNFIINKGKTNNRTLKKSPEIDIDNLYDKIHKNKELKPIDTLNENTMSNFNSLPDPNPVALTNNNSPSSLNNSERISLSEKVNQYTDNYYSNIANIEKPELITNNNKELINKLNYIINLLEEQSDEKSNNVIEEIILYSFLGIFIIFVLDSFTKTGKYIR